METAASRAEVPLPVMIRVGRLAVLLSVPAVQ